MQIHPRQNLRVEVIIDTVCPWCYIGKRRLETALAMEGVARAEILWRPFLLNPDMPSEGMPRRVYLATKFGGAESAERVYDVIHLTGARAGIDFNFDAIPTTPSSVGSHRLIQWCQTTAPDQATDLVEALFSAFFLEGRDIGLLEELLDIAAACGLPRDAVQSYLESDAGQEVIYRENIRAHRLGVTGVPCYIFNGRYTLAGAQEPEVLARMVRLARLEAFAP